MKAKFLSDSITRAIIGTNRSMLISITETILTALGREEK